MIPQVSCPHHLPIAKDETFHIKTNRVVAIVLAVLKAIQKAVTFPFRFMGSKTFSLPGLMARFPLLALKKLMGKNDPARSFCDQLFTDSGYHWFKHSNCTKNDAKYYLPYATATGSVHRNNSHWVVPFGYSPISTQFATELEKDGPVLFDRATGLKCMLLEKDDEVLVVFGALQSHLSQFLDPKDKTAKSVTKRVVASCIFNILGGCPNLYTQADKAIQEIRQQHNFKNKKFTVCGQSLGGSLASYVAMRQQITGISFNAFPLGPGLQKKIGQKKLQNASSVVTQVRTKGDRYADLPFLVKLADIALNFLGIRTAGIFGTCIEVPAIHKKSADTHVDIYGALAAVYNPEWTSTCLERYSSDNTLANSSTKKLAELVRQEMCDTIIR